MQVSYFWFYLSLMANVLCLSAVTTLIYHRVSQNKGLKALSWHLNFSVSLFFICLAIIVGMFAGEVFTPSTLVSNPLEFCLLIVQLPEEIGLLLVVVLTFVVAYPLWNNRQIIVKSQEKERADNRDIVEAARAILDINDSFLNGYALIMNHPDIPESIKKEFFDVSSLPPKEFRNHKQKSLDVRNKKLK